MQIFINLFSFVWNLSGIKRPFVCCSAVKKLPTLFRDYWHF